MPAWTLCMCYNEGKCSKSPERCSESHYHIVKHQPCGFLQGICGLHELFLKTGNILLGFLPLVWDTLKSFKTCEQTPFFSNGSSVSLWEHLCKEEGRCNFVLLLECPSVSKEQGTKAPPAYLPYTRWLIHNQRMSFLPASWWAALAGWCGTEKPDMRLDSGLSFLEVNTCCNNNYSRINELHTWWLHIQLLVRQWF